MPRVKAAFDYSKLKGKIREVFGKNSPFAKAIGTTSVSLNNKLNRGVSFTQTEIDKAIDVLKLSKADIPVYFFCTKSSEITEQKGA